MSEFKRAFALNPSVPLTGLHPGRTQPPVSPPSRSGLAADHLYLLGASWWAAFLTVVFTLELWLGWTHLHGGRSSDPDWKRHPSWFWWLFDDEIGVLQDMWTLIWQTMRWWLRLWLSSGGVPRRLYLQFGGETWRTAARTNGGGSTGTVAGVNNGCRCQGAKESSSKFPITLGRTFGIHHGPNLSPFVSTFCRLTVLDADTRLWRKNSEERPYKKETVRARSSPTHFQD